ncbi:MAG: peptidase S9 [Bacteroidales bacterium 36-12]|nr:MAG: peptidase S9 [Bacteroidales bacterium 36-12]
MNRLFLIVMMSATILATSCKSNENTNIIGKQNPTIVNGILTPDVLWAFGRVGGLSISPDKSKILYTVTYYSIAENKGNTEIFTMNIDGSDKKQITHTSTREGAAKWINDGKSIAFLSNESGSYQLWIMDANGNKRKQITNREGGIGDFLFSPDESKILFFADVKVKPSIAYKYPDLPLATGVIADDLMYKHWDEWVTSAPHPFIADFDGNNISNEIDILEGEPFESPMKPMGGIEQLTWSSDGKTIAYTCRKKTGKEYAISTNSDIYFYELESRNTINMTEGMLGYDINPVFSPDGKWLAWESQERDGYESDKHRLFVLNIQTGERRDLSINFEQNAESLAWSDDSKSIYFVSVWHGVSQIYMADIETGEIKKITSGVHDYNSVITAKDMLVGVKCSMSKPNEIYAINKGTGEEKELSYENKDILDQLEMGRVEERWITTTDNKHMLTWVIYPPHFDANKKYPTILYCQGGPQSPVSQFWSYRWNMQTFAANGYIIVAPNRRGLPGFGKEWNEQISGDYGGQNMKDYFSAIDALSKEPFVDEERLGCIGASYGGFSVYWLAGHHEKRFKAFIAHAGIFNLEQQYLETEELWFANWDMGGAYWDKKNAIAQRTYENSPHLFIEKWDTPILVTHGEKDYRILASQGMAAFNAAVIRGVPAKLLVFPDENHWISKPQNGILWQRTFAEWLDKWLK